MLASGRPSVYRCFPTKTHRPCKMDCRVVGFARGHPPAAAAAISPPKEETAAAVGGGERGEAVSLREWQGWGTSSPVPAMVTQVIEGLRSLERDKDAHMSFGGLGGKLQGDFKVHEDKKHRALYQFLTVPEEKLQFFAARQIACRLLGSRGYLCQKCWLPSEDCMCSKLVSCSIWHGIRFWLYMHPKDFLRQNNTGKLLWQIFGTEAASLCLFGIHEHEEMMWEAFRLAGKDMVWFLYPNKSTSTKSVQDTFFHQPLISLGQPLLEHEGKTLNFVLIDGTWSNSAAMYSRLKERAKLLWGDDLPCISLATLGVSVMHKLRPQPGWDRTCTAAAAIGLLSELHANPQFSSCGGWTSRPKRWRTGWTCCSAPSRLGACGWAGRLLGRRETTSSSNVAGFVWCLTISHNIKKMMIITGGGGWICSMDC